jgi:hypothetical protein
VRCAVSRLLDFTENILYLGQTSAETSIPGIDPSDELTENLFVRAWL